MSNSNFSLHEQCSVCVTPSQVPISLQTTRVAKTKSLAVSIFIVWGVCALHHVLFLWFVSPVALSKSGPVAQGQVVYHSTQTFYDQRVDQVPAIVQCD